MKKHPEKTGHIKGRFIDAAEMVTAAIGHQIEKNKGPVIDNYVALAQEHESVMGVCAVPYKSPMPVFHRSKAEQEESERDLYSVFVYFTNGYERAEVTFETPVERNEALIIAKEIMNEYGGMDILSDMPFIALNPQNAGRAYHYLKNTVIPLIDPESNQPPYSYIILPMRDRRQAAEVSWSINRALKYPERMSWNSTDKDNIVQLRPGE